MNETQEILSNESSKGIEPAKLEWRSFGAHYKCDVNVNEIASFWCWAQGNNLFIPVALSPLFSSNFLSAMKLEDAMNVINEWNNILAAHGYNIRPSLSRLAEKG